MSGIRKSLWSKFASRIFRQSYMAENVRTGIAYQIRAMRDSRKMSQGDMAKAMGKSQSNIARWEDPDYGNFSVRTLIEIANTFDVWVSIQFVSYGEGVKRISDKSPTALDAMSYEDQARLKNVFDVEEVSRTETRPFQTVKGNPYDLVLNKTVSPGTALSQ